MNSLPRITNADTRRKKREKELAVQRDGPPSHEFAGIFCCAGRVGFRLLGHSDGYDYLNLNSAKWTTVATPVSLSYDSGNVSPRFSTRPERHCGEFRPADLQKLREILENYSDPNLEEES